MLEEIANPKTNAEGKAKMGERLQTFSGLTGRVNPREFKWLVRKRDWHEEGDGEGGKRGGGACTVVIL